MAHSRITQRRRLPPSTTWSQSSGMGNRIKSSIERCQAIDFEARPWRLTGSRDPGYLLR
jgi:hypothetical protein